MTIFLRNQIITIIAVLIAQGAIAVSSCSDILKPHTEVQQIDQKSWGQDFQNLINDYRQKQDADKKGQINYNEYNSYKKKDFYPKLNSLFERIGVKVQIEEYNWGGVTILPSGNHFLGRLSQGLKKRGVSLIFSPLATAVALGMYSNRSVYIDLESIIKGRTSLVLAHELRHMHIDLNSENSYYEQIFSTRLSSSINKNYTLPGMNKDEAYSETYFLDEILAHRQSATALIREFQKSKTSVNENHLAILKVHGTRIRRFIETWLYSSEAMNEALRLNSVKFSPLFYEETGDVQSSLSFEIQKLGYFKKWFQKRDFTEQEDLRVTLRISENEIRKLKSSADITAFAINRINQITTEIKLLAPSVRAFDQALQDYKGQDFDPIEKTFSDFYSIIAKRQEQEK